VKKGGECIGKNCAHLINMRLGVQRGPNSIMQQVNKPPKKGNRKIVQFKFLFHILSHGYPMLEYEKMYDLLANLKVLDNPNMNWFNFDSWTFVEFIYQQV
jgi:hypothetical protein